MEALDVVAGDAVTFKILLEVTVMQTAEAAAEHAEPDGAVAAFDNGPDFGDFQPILLPEGRDGPPVVADQAAGRADPHGAVGCAQQGRRGGMDIFEAGRHDEVVALLAVDAATPGAGPHAALGILG